MSDGEKFIAVLVVASLFVNFVLFWITNSHIEEVYNDEDKK